MGRRIPRDQRPFLEEVERRELLSAITDVMAGNALYGAAMQSRAAAVAGIQASGSSQSIADSANQGPLLAGHPIRITRSTTWPWRRLEP